MVMHLIFSCSVPTDVEALVGGIVGGVALLNFAPILVAILVRVCCWMNGKSLYLKGLYFCLTEFLISQREEELFQ